MGRLRPPRLSEPNGTLMPPSAVLDNAGFAQGDTRVIAAHLPKPPMLRNNALMDAIFRNVTRFFAFVVFSLLAAILVSLVIGSLPALEKFGVGFLWNAEWNPV